MFNEIVCVSALWGCTNPVIKKNSKDISKITSSSKLGQFLLELKFLLTNIKYLVPMFVNQSGSVLYFITLQNADLSLSVPVANSLTFVFTAISGWVLNEQPPSKNTLLGIVLIIFGTSLCFYDNYLKEAQRS